MLAVGEQVLDHLAPQAACMATGFGGGVAGTNQELCGALSGGILVIGAAHGRISADADDELAYRLVLAYRDRFVSQLGDSQCEQLLAQVEGPGWLDSCTQLVEKAAKILLDVFAEVEPEQA